MSPVGLLAALDLEASVLAESLDRLDIASPGISVRRGDLDGKPLVLAVGGVGKVAAAMTAQFLCDVFQPSALICIGLAGAIGGTGKRGEVIVADGAVQHDLDARPLTTQKGEVPGLGSGLFEADARITHNLFHAARASVERPEIVREGLMLTGDQIIASAGVRDRLVAEFPGAACVDMETAAVAQVAIQNGLPWGAVRITSDSADETFDLEEVLEFGAKTAGELFDRIIRAALKTL